MAFYVGVSSTARKVKKMYVGVNGVARKVKKLYVGVNGIARKVFGGELTYVGTTTDAPGLHIGYAATNNGERVIFAGGKSGSTYYDNVVTYDSSLTKATPATLRNKAEYPAAAHNASYSLFGGGYTGSAYTKSVSAFNSSFVRSSPTDLSGSGFGTYQAYRIAGTNVGNYAVFYGAYSGGSAFNAYNNSLTKTAVASSDTRYNIAATHIGDYALFGGGNGSSAFNAVTVINSSLTVSSASNLSTSKGGLAAAYVGDYALFAGGNNGGTYSSKVDVYDTSLVKSTATDLSVARTTLAGTTIASGEMALFGGGQTSGYNNGQRGTVDAYDQSLVRTLPTELNTARYNLRASHVGDYALFGTGQDTVYLRDVVDVYEF